jgi:hypothetical protein
VLLRQFDSTITTRHLCPQRNLDAGFGYASSTADEHVSNRRCAVRFKDHNPSPKGQCLLCETIINKPILAAALQSGDFKVVSPRGAGEKSGIVSIELTTVEEAKRHHHTFDNLNFILSRYGRIIRMAPHFFNEQVEIGALLQAMQKNRVV